MYREWKKIQFPKEYHIWIWEQQDWEVDQEIDARWSEGGWKYSWWRRVTGKSTYQTGMEEAPENGKESSHTAHVKGMN